MSDLLELAARCEAATGPDRELDAEIALALGIVTERDGNVFFGHKDYSCMVLERSYYDIEGSAPELPAYTASLDAAMTLVPDGWSISMHLSENGLYPCVNMGRSYPTNANVAQEGATLPRTITAASLRARASVTPTGNPSSGTTAPHNNPGLGVAGEGGQG